MYSPEAFNPFWVGQPDYSFGSSRMVQYTSSYKPFAESGTKVYNMSSVGGGSIPREYSTYGENFNGDYAISDGNHDLGFNKDYDVGRYAHGSNNRLEGGFDNRLEGGFDNRFEGSFNTRIDGGLAAGGQERARRSRGSCISFGYDNSSSPMCFMR